MIITIILSFLNWVYCHHIYKWTHKKFMKCTMKLED